LAAWIAAQRQDRPPFNAFIFFAPSRLRVRKTFLTTAAWLGNAAQRRCETRRYNLQ